jgi:hypothetical protein
LRRDDDIHGIDMAKKSIDVSHIGHSGKIFLDNVQHLSA